MYVCGEYGPKLELFTDKRKHKMAFILFKFFWAIFNSDMIKQRPDGATIQPTRIVIIEKSFQLPCIIVLFQCMALLLYCFLLEVDNVWWHAAKRNRNLLAGYIMWIFCSSVLSDIYLIWFITLCCRYCCLLLSNDFRKPIYYHHKEIIVISIK